MKSTTSTGVWTMPRRSASFFSAVAKILSRRVPSARAGALRRCRGRGRAGGRFHGRSPGRGSHSRGRTPRNPPAAHQVPGPPDWRRRSRSPRTALRRPAHRMYCATIETASARVIDPLIDTLSSSCLSPQRVRPVRPLTFLSCLSAAEAPGPRSRCAIARAAQCKGNHPEWLRPEGLIPCLRDQAVPGPFGHEIRETREMQVHAGDAQPIGRHHIE